jgi:CBS domain containing-hemolysin-like protein
MSTPVALLVMVLLLAGNAFFVGAEFAVITARKDRLEALAAAGRRRARLALSAGAQLPLLIAGAQLGVTVCSLLLGAIAEPAISGLLEAPLSTLGVPLTAVHVVGFLVALAIVATLHTLFGEMVAKNLAIAGPERAAMWLVPIHYAFCRMTKPLLVAFTAAARLVLRLMRTTPKDELESGFTPEELATLIAESRREGLLDPAEHRRLANTLSSAERTVADVMVPFRKLTTLPVNPTLQDMSAAVAATGFSRFPLVDAHGRFHGYLHVKDVLEIAECPASTSIPRARVRDLPELPSNARLDEALATLRRAHSHVGVVVDPQATGDHRRALGLLALEDLVEEYVGTVRDSTHVDPAGRGV